MATLTQAQLKRLTAVHGWSGMVLGLLLYAVVLTGTVVVFGHEIAIWSAGGTSAQAPLAGPIDSHVRRVAGMVTKGYHEGIDAWSDVDGNLMVFPHAHARDPRHDEITDYGAVFRVDPATGDVLDRKDGFLWHEPSWYAGSALEQFLVDLHVQLYVPEPWGLILTGVLGLAMMAAGVTGVLVHRHLIRDLFVAERPGARLVSARDRHVLAASWSLPFAILLAFTGSFFSFAGTLGLPMVAAVAFGGDEQKVVAALYSPPVAEDARPTRLADIDDVVARSTVLAGAPPIWVTVERYGRADARIGVWHDPPAGRLSYVHNMFDGADGGFLGERPSVGNAPSAAATLTGIMGPLHFGNFAGVLSKSVWVGLGAAMCFVILTGMRLWLRRRESEPLWRGFRRALTVVGYGLPLGMLAAAYAFFLALPAGDTFWWTPAGFVIGAVACIAFGCMDADPHRLGRTLRAVAGVGCLGLPVLRLACGGTSWAAALAAGDAAIVSLDLLFLLGGAALLLWRWRAGVPLPVAEPAE